MLYRLWCLILGHKWDVYEWHGAIARTCQRCGGLYARVKVQ